MNTEKIKIGDIIDSYKELCQLIGEDVKDGNSRKSQLKEFERYFQYEKHGRKFLILDIYDKPLNKIDKRKDGNRKIYVTYIESILLSYLCRLDGYTGYFTKRQLWRLLGMINQLYGEVKIDDLQKINSNITSWELNKFYQICDFKLSSILFSALNNLRNRSLIMYEEQYSIIDIDGDIHIASDAEKKIILRAENTTLSKMGYYSKSHVALCFKMNEFYKNVNGYLEEYYGWKEVFKQYKIIFLDRPYLQKALNENEILLNKLLLNKKVVNAVNNHTQNLDVAQKEKLDIAYNNALEQIKENNEELWDVMGENILDRKTVAKDYNIFTYPDCFIEVQKMLSQKLLKLPNDNNKSEDSSKLIDNKLDN